MESLQQQLQFIFSQLISRFLSIFLKTMRILRFYITVLFKQSPTLKFFSHTISASSRDCNASMQISYFFIVEAPQRKFWMGIWNIWVVNIFYERFGGGGGVRYSTTKQWKLPTETFVIQLCLYKYCKDWRCWHQLREIIEYQAAPSSPWSAQLLLQFAAAVLIVLMTCNDHLKINTMTQWEIN